MKNRGSWRGTLVGGLDRLHGVAGSLEALEAPTGCPRGSHESHRCPRPKHAAKEPAKPSLKLPVLLASLEGTVLPVQAIPSRIPSDVGV